MEPLLPTEAPARVPLGAQLEVIGLPRLPDSMVAAHCEVPSTVVSCMMGEKCLLPVPLEPSWLPDERYVPRDEYVEFVLPDRRLETYLRSEKSEDGFRVYPLLRPGAVDVLGSRRMHFGAAGRLSEAGWAMAASESGHQPTGSRHRLHTVTP